MRELEELVKKAQSSFYIPITSSLKEDRDHLKKMNDFFSMSYEILAREMMDEVKTLVKVLQLAVQSGGSTAAYRLLNRLKACFDAPSNCSLEVVILTAIEAAKNWQLAEAHQVLSFVFYFHPITQTYN